MRIEIEGVGAYSKWVLRVEDVKGASYSHCVNLHIEKDGKEVLANLYIRKEDIKRLARSL